MWEAGAAIISGLMVIISSGVGYLLVRKDSAQEEQIKELFRKHEDDAGKLNILELKLAHEYHSKTDLKDVLENLKMFFNERFDRMEDAIGVERRREK